MPLHALIIGAGIGGLTTALALRRSGHNVTILEKHPLKTEVGFAVGNSPNATRVLRSLGLDFKKARMVPCTGEATINAAQWPFELVKLVSGDMEREYGAPWMTMHRVDLHNALREVCEGEGEGEEQGKVVVREGVEVVEFGVDGSVRLRDGEVVRGDFVVATDGVKSKAHKEVVGEERPAKLTGVSNVRFCVPTSKMLEVKELRSWIELAGDTTTITYGNEKGGMALRYPCRDHELQNFGIYALEESTPENQQKWITRMKKDMARERLKGFHPSVLKLLDLCEEGEMYLWKIADRDPLPTYHKNRLIVLGDSAHPMLPTFGNGAGMAIEDAGALGVIMKGAGKGDVVERLAIWDQVRRPRTSAVQVLCRSTSFGYTLSERSIKMAREHLSEEELPEFTREAVNKMLFSYDVLEAARKAVEGGKRDSPVHSSSL